MTTPSDDDRALERERRRIEQADREAKARAHAAAHPVTPEERAALARIFDPEETQ